MQTFIGFLLLQAIFLSLSLFVVTVSMTLEKVTNLFNKLRQQLETEKQGE